MAMDDNGGGDDIDDVVMAPTPPGEFFVDARGGRSTGWDHDPQHPQSSATDDNNNTTYSNVDTNTALPEYEPSAASIEDFEPMHFDHEFPDPNQTEFHHESATVFDDFGDDHHADTGNPPSSFMDLYSMSIYPDITSEATTGFGIYRTFLKLLSNRSQHSDIVVFE